MRYVVGGLPIIIYFNINRKTPKLKWKIRASLVTAFLFVYLGLSYFVSIFFLLLLLFELWPPVPRAQMYRKRHTNNYAVVLLPFNSFFCVSTLPHYDFDPIKRAYLLSPIRKHTSRLGCQRRRWQGCLALYALLSVS